MRLEEDFVQAMDAVQVGFTLVRMEMLSHFCASHKVIDLLAVAMQEYLELQSAIESQLRHGFMHLSIARYASGSNRISLLQIPSRLTAQTRFGGEQQAFGINSLLLLC